MPPSAIAVWLGLQPYELLTLLGIVIGPIAAVLITLWADARRRDRDQRTQVVRMLLNTRRLPADPVYSVAINLIPVEFQRHRKVMVAWRAYIEAVRYRPTPENRETHEKRVNGKQTALLFQMMRSLGINVTETDLEADGYVSEGFVWRDNLYLDSLTAARETADALKRQNELTERLVNGAAVQSAAPHGLSSESVS